jgi:hypothetical protein
VDAHAHALAQGRRAFWLTVGAFAWGVALVAAALLVPESGSQTLVAVNGPHVLLVVGAPAVISALVWIALRQRCARGSTAAGYLAWALIAILIAECLAGVASVGIFIAPVAALLAYAASITPRAAA